MNKQEKRVAIELTAKDYLLPLRAAVTDSQVSSFFMPWLTSSTCRRPAKIH